MPVLIFTRKTDKVYKDGKNTRINRSMNLNKQWLKLNNVVAVASPVFVIHGRLEEGFVTIGSAISFSSFLLIR